MKPGPTDCSLRASHWQTVAVAVVDVCGAIPSADAASFLLEAAERSDTGSLIPAPLWGHAACYLPEADLPRLVSRGRECAACHAVGVQGDKLAPGLSGVGVRGVERLCEDILAPNRNTVPTASIEERVNQEVSLMPEGFAEAIPPAEFSDLLAFLLTLMATAPQEPGRHRSSAETAGQRTSCGCKPTGPSKPDGINGVSWRW